MSGPITGLADDVLLEIFLQCLPPDHWDVKYSPEEAPVLLLRVCKYWHALAAEHGVLWSRHNLVYRQGMPLEHKLPVLEGLLLRAKATPLSLRIATKPQNIGRLREPVAASSLPMPNLVNRLVLPVVGSISRLVLQGISIRDLHGLASGQLSRLQSLVLDFRYSDDASTFTWATAGPIKAFSDCTSLHRVLLNDAGGLQNIALPLRALTHYFQYNSAEPASKFMLRYPRDFQQLRHLHVEVDICDPLAASAPVVVMESLETLSLSFWGRMDVNVNVGYPTFFDRVQFPNLQQLRLDGLEMPFHVELWTTSHVERFLGTLRSLEHLDTLSLSLFWLNSTFLQPLFEATSRITTLDLDLHEDFHTVFRTLTVPDAASPFTLLPNLHTLVIEMGYTASVGSDWEHINPDVFSRFLESRMLLPPERRLRKVVFYTTIEHPEEVDDTRPFVQVVKKFVDKGLAFERCFHPTDSDTDLSWMARSAKLAHWEECCSFL